jgi:septum formation protein
VASPAFLAGRYDALVLASTSPARRALLETLGLPFRAEAPGVDEDVPVGTSPREAVALLAERKARAVAGKAPLALVVGSDQMVVLDQAPLQKPPDAASARKQLAALSGRTHEVVTGVCVVGPGFFACEVDLAWMRLEPLSADELDAYVATGEWQGCAGGYRVEGRGQALFHSIEGDRTGVMGLPMTRLVRLLREAGVKLLATSG